MPRVARDNLETVRKLQRAVVMPIVAHEPIDQRRLWRGCHECRMGVDHPGCLHHVVNRALTDAVDMAANAYQRDGGLSGISCGLKDIDEKMGGLTLRLGTGAPSRTEGAQVELPDGRPRRQLREARG